MIWNFIGSHVGETIAVLVIGAVILLRFRRYRAVAGAAVATVSSAATVAAGILGALVLLVALGYWDPPLGGDRGRRSGRRRNRLGYRR